MGCIDVKRKKELNIFVSYGHKDDNSSRKVPEVVDAIIEQLRKRNHNVWLDVDKLKDADVTNWPNSDWRSAIYTNIKNSDNVVGFLSEKALRKSGVCLDELSIAVSIPGRRIVTILLESQETMKIPPTVSRIQWVDMSEWKNHYDFASEHFFEDGYFEEKLAEIVDRIEQEENHIYQYDINFLVQVLNPSNTVKTDLFDLLQHESDEAGNYIYEDRTWLKEKIFDFISGDKHYLLLIGGPGYGKSQFIAHCIHNIEDIYAYYFVKYNKTEGKNDCNVILRTLAFEIAVKMPEYRRSLIDSIKAYLVFSEERLSDISNYFSGLTDIELFEHLFHCDMVHFIDGNPGRIVISIDALDEAEYNGNNPVANLLLTTKDRWPIFFKFILTSRETGNVLSCFDYLGQDCQIARLDTGESDDDVKRYLRKNLEKEDINDVYFDELTSRCEKTFIYARLLIQSIENGFMKLETIDDILLVPKGYNGLLQHYFSRAFNKNEFDEVKLPLGIMLANGGSINRRVLEQVVREQVPDWTAGNFFLQMKSFVVLQGDVVCFYHKALNDWLRGDESGLYHIDENPYKSLIVNFCKRYIKAFNKTVEEHYSDTTGMDMFEDAEENGFDYETVKYVFKNSINLMTKAEKIQFKSSEIAFLTLILWMSYRHSELTLLDEVFAIIKQNARKIKSYDVRKQFYIAIAYNIAGESEQARNNQIPNSKDIQAANITAVNCHSAIEYFWFIRNEFEQLPEFGKLYSSVMDNIAFNTRLMDEKSHEKLELALSILEDLKIFELKELFDGVEISLAHLYYHEGIIHYDMKLYDKALECLKTAEEYINQYDEEDYLLGEGLFALVLNQRAACNSRIGERLKDVDIDKANIYYKNSIDDIKKSLEIKLRLFGENSFYVAVAYDNIARFSKAYEIAQPTFVKLSSGVYDYALRAIEIAKRIFSENGKTTARSYMTLAWCMDADKMYDKKFVGYIKKAVEISPVTYKKDAAKLYNNAIEYYKNISDLEEAIIFIEEAEKLQ